MLAQGSGSIVNVSSKAGLSGGASGVAYTASKHGLVSQRPGPTQAGKW
jgi:NAD(P)-dependent dehydrogenase (short-subunit alcohol dehydrogenase family)